LKSGELRGDGYPLLAQAFLARNKGTIQIKKS
jgi:hypothetical protein